MPTVLWTAARPQARGESPVKLIAEHIFEGLGRIPALKDWFAMIQLQRWMSPPAKLRFRNPPEEKAGVSYNTLGDT